MAGQIIIFFSIAFFAALIGSIAGLGGGVIALPIYLFLFHNDFFQATLYSFIGMMFTTVISVIKYSQQKTMPEMKKIIPLLSGTSIGLFFSMQYIQPIVNENNLQDSIGFNILLICVLLTSSTFILLRNKIKVFYISEIYLFPFSIIASIVASLIGIGMSSIFFPVLLILYGMSAKKIPVNLLFITAFIAICSILEKTLILNIHLENPWYVLPIGIGAILGGVIGPIINKKIKHNYILYLNVAIRFAVIISVLIPMFL